MKKADLLFPSTYQLQFQHHVNNDLSISVLCKIIHRKNISKSKSIAPVILNRSIRRGESDLLHAAASYTLRENNPGRARSEPGGTRWRTEGKWRGNWRMEWVANILTPPPNVDYPALLKLMRTPRLPAVDWTDAPTDLNGLVRFGERRNLVSARVPSRSARAIPAEYEAGWGPRDSLNVSGHEKNPFPYWEWNHDSSIVQAVA